MPRAFTNTELIQNIKIRSLHSEGLGHVEIARRIGMTTSSTYRRMKKLQLTMGPPNGSHRRVDVCACGQPAMTHGSKCVDCRRVQASTSSKNSYRRRMNLPPEKWRVA